jgi:hypothetical protein
MTRSRLRFLAPALLLLAAPAAGCAERASPDVPPAQEAEPAGPSIRYTREFTFLGTLRGAPLVAPFLFQTVDGGADLARSNRAWLAHGPTWDAFLDDRWTTSKVGGAWRVLPHGSLRIAAGGATEIESFQFQREERSLRLELGDPASGWQQARDLRFRLLDGRLILGPEAVPGTVLEALQVERSWDRAAGEPRESDAIFLASGDTLRLLLSETIARESQQARGHGWLINRGQEQVWDRAQIRWLEVRPYEQARRDIPLRWSYRVPGTDVEGEIQALGFDVVLGSDRGGRRAVEARYTVEGWVSVNGVRGDVVGMVRHIQD